MYKINQKDVKWLHTAYLEKSTSLEVQTDLKICHLHPIFKPKYSL